MGGEKDIGRAGQGEVEMMQIQYCCIFMNNSKTTLKFKLKNKIKFPEITIHIYES